MRKLQTREEILASRMGAMNEMVFKMGDTYQVKFVADVPKSLVNAFVSKAKKEYDRDPREIWSDMDLAELFVKYVTTTFLNIDSLPVEAALGEKNSEETGTAQGTVDGVQTQPVQTPQPAQSTQPQPAQLQDETKIAEIPAALQVESVKTSVRTQSKKKILTTSSTLTEGTQSGTVLDQINRLDKFMMHSCTDDAAQVAYEDEAAAFLDNHGGYWADAVKADEDGVQELLDKWGNKAAEFGFNFANNESLKKKS